MGTQLPMGNRFTLFQWELNFQWEIVDSPMGEDSNGNLSDRMLMSKSQTECSFHNVELATSHTLRPMGP